MSRGKTIGKSVLLILLILILSLFGVVWFDFIGVIQAKKYFAPLYKLLHLTPQTSVSATEGNELEFDLYEDRIEKRLEAIDLEKEALAISLKEIEVKQQLNDRTAQELKDKEKELQEREKTFNNRVEKYDKRSENIELAVSRFNGMPPADAVNILSEMDDQDVIDILNRMDEIAAENGVASNSGYYLSLMDNKVAADRIRKSLNKTAVIQ